MCGDSITVLCSDAIIEFITESYITEWNFTISNKKITSSNSYYWGDVKYHPLPNNTLGFEYKGKKNMVAMLFVTIQSGNSI